MLAAAGGLGGVKRKVGVADEGVGAGAPGIADGNADRGSDRDLVAFDHVGARDLLDQRPRERFEQADVGAAGEHGLEFVAAQPADLAMVAHHRCQPIGDLAKQRVADRMAERVVDVLEPIEVDHEQGAALLAMGRVAQRFVERLTHHRAVGQRVSELNLARREISRSERRCSVRSVPIPRKPRNRPRSSKIGFPESDQ